MQEKGRWEERIRTLGGPDYKKNNSQVLDADGLELPGTGDYKYYGVAKDLPKVRELFEKDKPQAPAKRYEDLNKKVGYAYFKFNQRDDPNIVSKEQEIETHLRNEAIAEFKEKHKEYLAVKKRIKIGENEEHEIREGEDSEDLDDFENIHENAALPLATSNELDVPITQNDIKKLILQKKKEALIKKYASEAMEGQDGNAKMEVQEI